MEPSEPERATEARSETPSSHSYQKNGAMFLLRAIPNILPWKKTCKKSFGNQTCPKPLSEPWHRQFGSEKKINFKNNVGWSIWLKNV